VPERNKLLAETYLKYVKDKKTVVFCASVRHAHEIDELFKQQGVKCEAVSGSMKSAERSRILHQYENGAILYAILDDKNICLVEFELIRMQKVRERRFQTLLLKEVIDGEESHIERSNVNL
jgi:tyrosine-protein phosphatase YwqE